MGGGGLWFFRSKTIFFSFATQKYFRDKLSTLFFLLEFFFSCIKCFQNIIFCHGRDINYFPSLLTEIVFSKTYLCLRSSFWYILFHNMCIYNWGNGHFWIRLCNTELFNLAWRHFWRKPYSFRKLFWQKRLY